ncbi:hypothetical protein PG996_006887 [Apiospora saccharicola]|uniref:BTB domain-containing protein n=1 Tax=Apiospora saccharicola TaxID=335842 RepID=A0ABR1VC04_9PEZI
MASSQHVSELLRSLKKLFDSGVYTDLKIVCGNDQHQVHKAIVCLRSGRLAQLCSEIGPNQEATITIPDDDPQAIDLMLQYLYTLEYSPRLVAPTTTTKSLTNGVNGINGHHQKDDTTPSPKTPATNGVGTTSVTTNGTPPQSQTQKPQAPPATTLEYNIEREAVEAVPTTDAAAKLSKKATKKKKRSSTVTAETLDAAASPTSTTAPDTTTVTSTPSTATTTTANAAAQTVPPAAIGKPTNGPATVPQPAQHSLLQHAKLYTLAQKYGVPGLRALSASRFAAEAEEYWSSDDFLAAAVEAYNTANNAASTAPTNPHAKQVAATVVASILDEGPEDDSVKTTSIRDVVLSNMKAHPELLDRAAVREVMRVNAELSFDLMMHFRDNQQNGGSASSVVSGY